LIKLVKKLFQRVKAFVQIGSGKSIDFKRAIEGKPTYLVVDGMGTLEDYNTNSLSFREFTKKDTKELAEVVLANALPYELNVIDKDEPCKAPKKRHIFLRVMDSVFSIKKPSTIYFLVLSVLTEIAIFLEYGFKGMYVLVGILMAYILSQKGLWSVSKSKFKRFFGVGLFLLSNISFVVLVVYRISKVFE